MVPADNSFKVEVCPHVGTRVVPLTVFLQILRFEIGRLLLPKALHVCSKLSTTCSLACTCRRSLRARRRSQNRTAPTEGASGRSLELSAGSSTAIMDMPGASRASRQAAALASNRSLAGCCRLQSSALNIAANS